MNSIERIGLLQPLVVNDYGDGSYELLVGNTRAEAWRRLYEQKKIKSIWIPCKVVRLGSLEAERLIVESNRQRVKTDLQIQNEVRELTRIETELAKQRQGARTDIRTISSESSMGRVREKVAAITGEGIQKTQQRMDINKAVAEGDKSPLAVLKKGGSVNAAYKEIKRQKRERKPETQSKVAELQKLVGRAATVQASKNEGKFNLFFYKKTEAEIRQIAKAIA